MNQQTIEEKNKRAWNNLRAGYNRVWLCEDDIVRLNMLRAGNVIPDRSSPACVLGAYLGLSIEDQANNITPIAPIIPIPASLAKEIT